ncbi:glycerol-3-phosphate dehydrogenase/oxidase, partial [Singulisphaera rosea]
TMIAPSQGIHVVLDRSFLPGNSAMLIPQTDDGRVLFAIPWHNKVLLGTTDTPVDHTEIEPRPQAAEVDFLLEHAGRYLSVKPRRSDILSQFAGLRPLVKAGHPTESARLSREHALTVSASGLITITGGKWTTYRRMASDAVDKAAEVGELPGRPCVTATWHLHGWTPEAGSGPYATYGADLPILERLIAERPEWGRLIHPRLPQREGEVVWAAREEMARTVEDVLSRRTRALVLDARAALEAAPLVASLLAQELGHDTAWQEGQVREFGELCRGYLPDL